MTRYRMKTRRRIEERLRVQPHSTIKELAEKLDLEQRVVRNYLLRGGLEVERTGKRKMWDTWRLSKPD